MTPQTTATLARVNRISKYEPASEKVYRAAIKAALKSVQLELIETKGEWNRKRMAEIVKILRKDLHSPTATFLIDFFDDLFSTIWKDTKAMETAVKGVIKTPLFTLDKKTVEYVLSFKEVYFHRYNKDGVSKYSLISVDDLLKYTERDVVKKVKSIINTGAITGVNPNEIVNQIGTLKGVSSAHLRTAVRTMFADAQNRIQMEFLKKNQDLYDNFEFVAKIDPRTSKICDATDGKTWKEFDDIPRSYYPPLHPNCRSIIVGNIVFEVEDVELGEDFDFINKFITDESKEIIHKIRLPKIRRTGAGEGSKYNQVMKIIDSKRLPLDFMHEYGHHIDHSLGTYKTGVSASMLKDAWLKDAKIFEKLDYTQTALTHISKAIDNNFGSQLGDLYDSFTHGKIWNDLGLGHGARYWKGADNRESEAFANMFQMWSTNGQKEYNGYKKYAPNLTAAFEKIIKDIQDDKLQEYIRPSQR